jgi:fatty-acyl-CoA synthase
MSTPADVSLAAWLGDRARLTPKRRALTFEGVTWSYEEFVARVDQAAGALRDLGVRHGDRVGFLGLNSLAFFELLFASARIGAIYVPLNFRLTGPELSFVIGDAGVHTLVVDDGHKAVIEGVRGELPCRRFLASETASDDWASLADACAEAVPYTGHERIDPDEVALIMYTSGTTGRPKGAMLTHANLWWNNVAALLLADVLETDVSLVCAPLFHIGGLNVTTLQALMKGAELVVHRSFDPGRFIEDIGHYGVTTVFAVPAMLLFVSQHPTFDDADLTTLRSIICGGAPVPEALIKLYNGRGVQINQGYGLTETSPCATFLTPEWSLAKLGSAGRPPMLVDVKLVDADGRRVSEPMARGELCVRGPNVMRGYWNRPIETAQVIDPDGWFHTGDVAYADEDGFFYISDRIKDMVITGGENVYPAEVESVLYDYPAIADVAVIGVPDERWGEAIVAVVVPRPGETVELEALREFAGERLARYKLPARVENVDVIPRNPAGKVLKFELRERFGAK